MKSITNVLEVFTSVLRSYFFLLSFWFSVAKFGGAVVEIFCLSCRIHFMFVFEIALWDFSSICHLQQLYYLPPVKTYP
jgi:hypothetical protein